jgi:hypothetical protein
VLQQRLKEPASTTAYGGAGPCRPNGCLWELELHSSHHVAVLGAAPAHRTACSPPCCSIEAGQRKRLDVKKKDSVKKAQRRQKSWD